MSESVKKLNKMLKELPEPVREGLQKDWEQQALGAKKVCDAMKEGA